MFGLKNLIVQVLDQIMLWINQKKSQILIIYLNEVKRDRNQKKKKKN